MRAFTICFSVLLAALLGAGGCDSGGEVDLGLPGIPEPIDPADFVDRVDNPYWPLAPSTTYSYAWEEDGEPVTDEVEVLSETRMVNGVEATVVRDRLYRNGALEEETWDWFAQDKDGNVWYLGEESYTITGAQRVLDQGSWESGVDGARAGLYMPAEPTVGDYYYQEYRRGRAQDVAEVVALGRDVQVPAGVFKNCVEIRETTPLEPDALEIKSFCPAVGLALTVDVAEGGTRQELVMWGGL